MKINKGLLTASAEIDVQFYDVDAMRVVWHGHYVKYIENARCELLKAFEYNYDDMEQSGYFWPIIDLRLKYVKSAKFGEKLRIDATLIEYETRLKIAYRVISVQTNEILCKAYTVQVAVDMVSGEMQFQSPAVLIEKLVKNIPEFSPDD